MYSKRIIVSASAIAVIFAAGWLIFGEPPERGAAGNSEVMRAQTIDFDDLFEDERRRLDISGLNASLRCVDSGGMMTCGAYEGQSALYFAVLLGSEHQITKLLRPEILNEHGIAALNVAAALGDLRIVKLLMSQEAMKELYEQLHFDRHPAIQAARFGNSEILELFVEQGLDTNQKFSDGYQDLFVEAVVQQQVEVARYLLESGYELNCQLRFPNGRSIGNVISGLGNKEIENLYASHCGSKTSQVQGKTLAAGRTHRH